MANAQDDHVITVSCATEYPAYEADKDAKCWGLVTLKASHYEPEELKRPALDIVAVIDKSGSMKGEKLFLVKKSLEFLVQNLLEKDRLCVITYDTNVFVDFKLLAMKSENQDYAKQKIQEIKDGTSTNLCGGLLQGLCEILDRKQDKNEVASVLLFTDGLANQGITRKSMIIKAMKNPKKYLTKTPSMLLQNYQNMVTQPFACSNVEPQQQQVQQVQSPAPNYQNMVTQPFACSNVEPQQQQVQQVQSPAPPASLNRNRIFDVFRAKPAVQSSCIVKEIGEEPNARDEEMEEEKVAVDINASVYTFGFGTDHDPDLLKAISDAANGMYFYIENDEQISESFGHCFGGLVSTLGQNINLNLELRDGVSVDKIHTNRNITSDDGLRNWNINLGDLQSEEQRDVLLVLNLPPTSSSDNPGPILKTSLTYFCVVDSTHKDSYAEMVVERKDNVLYSSDTTNLAVDLQRNRVLTTKAIKEALEIADEERLGALDLAKQRLNEEIKRVKESLTGNDEFCKLLVKDLEQSLLGLRDRVSYESSGKKSYLNLLQMHSAQRSNRITSNPYSNTSAELYQAKFK